MGNWHIKMVLFQNCVWWSRPLTKMAAQHRTLWKIHIKTILSGTSGSIRTKLWWNSHWNSLDGIVFQNCVRQSCSPTKMAATVQLCCYWKQLWSRWTITGSWDPLVGNVFYIIQMLRECLMFFVNVVSFYSSSPKHIINWNQPGYFFFQCFWCCVNQWKLPHSYEF